MTEEQKQVPCEVYSRIVGYLRPVDSWNQAKQTEFEERKTYEVTDDEDRDSQTREPKA